ncbi:hypothetical protein FR483_n718R [Paramecium bursaria Chlorella virus FR483]|uniref:Uncharacterized protein n718R n=1 Tax=Paramecium bursaria Chlorella virus FR483 TaxID=399781 RepID=A7J872_PBCVF|nr:hypothetical protein FR483_n718R [Paramecium bursaria Chlorella virus FR483]ABT16003.1 hypothetical protein FR483_n718R [Paramecium bursaria Chlorella virus FR483]
MTSSAHWHAIVGITQLRRSVVPSFVSLTGIANPASLLVYVWHSNVTYLRVHEGRQGVLQVIVSGGVVAVKLKNNIILVISNFVVKIHQVAFLALSAKGPVNIMVAINTFTRTDEHSLLGAPHHSVFMRLLICQPHVISTVGVLVEHCFKSFFHNRPRLRRSLGDNHRYT